MKKFFLPLLFLFLIPFVAPAEQAPSTTFLIYMCGTDLEEDNSFASLDLQEMMRADLPKGGPVTVLVETGGVKEWRNRAMTAGRNQRFEVIGHELVLRDDSLGKRNMGKPETLISFLEWGLSYAPADRVILVLWSHGGGPIEGVCPDPLYNHDSLTLLEMNRALKTGLRGKTLDAVMMDACLMASGEVAAVLSPYARYMAASQDIIPGVGLPYEALLTALKENPAMDTQSFLQLAADALITQAEKEAYPYSTFSVVDLKKAEKIAPALRDLAEGMEALLENGKGGQLKSARSQLTAFGNFDPAHRENTDLIDIRKLCDALEKLLPGETKALKTAVIESVVYRRSTGDIDPHAKGLSIFFPLNTVHEYPDYLTQYAHLSGGGAYADFVYRFGSQVNDLKAEEERSGVLDSVASFFAGLFASPTQAPPEKTYPGLWEDLDQLSQVIVDPYPGLWLDLN